jgi:hypothetical protein
MEIRNVMNRGYVEDKIMKRVTDLICEEVVYAILCLTFGVLDIYLLDYGVFKYHLLLSIFLIKSALLIIPIMFTVPKGEIIKNTIFDVIYVINIIPLTIVWLVSKLIRKVGG